MNNKNLVLMALIGASAGLMWTSQAEARPGRVSQVPNNEFSCGLCHAGGGTGPRNDFGLDVEGTMTEPGPAGQVQWSEIFNLDSDGDGCTNGQELGDPNGEWKIGDPNPDGTISDPSDEGSSQECDAAPNNEANNEGNNEVNNGEANNEAGEPGDGDGGGDGGGGDEGCTTAPGRTSGAGVFLLMLGLLFLRRRQS